MAHDLGEGLVVLLGHPAALAAHPPAAHVEHLHRHLELVLLESEDVGVRAVTQHDGRLLERLAERDEVVAQPGRLLELHGVGCGLHLALEPLDEPGRVAGHEVAEVLGDLPVLLGGDPPDAGCGALVDVAQQTRPAHLPGPLEHPGRAGAHREHPQQQVERLADRPGVAVGTEVAGALALGPAHHLGARELLTRA